MNQVYSVIEELISYAKANLGLHARNEDYVKNSIIRLLKLEAYEPTGIKSCEYSKPEALLEKFTAACVNAGIFPIEESEYYCDAVMGELMLSPKAVEDEFYKIYENSSKDATEWFYDYSVKSDYVKWAKLQKNPRFDSNGLIVTINLAKPEFRDPKKAQSGNSVKGGYPKCTICHQNEGFAGRSKRTLRTIDLTLGGQEWFWQFSPYGYFYQHGIAVNYEHTPMHVDKGTFTRLLDFVDRFPHYFIGCNAPLPRIGGSVLAHDHYQGGGEILPMHKASAAYILKNPQYPDTIAEIVDWPSTVIRIVSENRSEIEEICSAINDKWVNYNDEACGIVASDKDGVHNATSPTVIKTARGYEMSLLLRSNLTSDEYPDGIFHAHPEFHIIKKESIGLIEAQGLFILPGRFVKELDEVENCIVNGVALPEELSEFQDICAEIKTLCNDDYSKENVNKATREELGSVCARILENTAVFKHKEKTVEFLKDLGFDI